MLKYQMKNIRSFTLNHNTNLPNSFRKHLLLPGHQQLMIPMQKQVMIQKAKPLMLTSQKQLIVPTQKQLIVAAQKQLIVAAQKQLIVPAQKQLIVPAQKQLMLSGSIFINNRNEQRRSLSTRSLLRDYSDNNSSSDDSRPSFLSKYTNYYDDYLGGKPSNNNKDIPAHYYSIAILTATMTSIPIIQSIIPVSAISTCTLSFLFMGSIICADDSTWLHIKINNPKLIVNVALKGMMLFSLCVPWSYLISCLIIRFDSKIILIAAPIAFLSYYCMHKLPSKFFNDVYYLSISSAFCISMISYPFVQHIGWQYIPFGIVLLKCGSAAYLSVYNKLQIEKRKYSYTKFGRTVGMMIMPLFLISSVIDGCILISDYSS
jgi:hypothetical protein